MEFDKCKDILLDRFPNLSFDELIQLKASVIAEKEHYSTQKSHKALLAALMLTMIDVVIADRNFLYDTGHMSEHTVSREDGKC